jgi:hypothetical protein
MSARKRTRREATALRAFRDAMRDILEAEGWFEMSLAPEPRRDHRWLTAPTATA